MRPEIVGVSPATPRESVYLDIHIKGHSTSAQFISMTGHFGYGKTLLSGEESDR